MKKTAMSGRRRASLIVPSVFLALIFSFSVVNTLKPDKAHSESENRKLEQRPKFSLSTLFDGSYIKKVEEYVSDQFIGRDFFVGAKTQADFLMGKRDSNNIYFGKDGYLFELYDDKNVDKELLDKNTQRIYDFILEQNKSLGADKVKLMLIPSASEVLADKLPAYAPVFDQKTSFLQLKESLYQNYVDVSAALAEHSDEEIFYKTDHHWTTLGAYYSYRAFCEKNNSNGYTLKDYKIKRVSNDFFGTLYSKARLVSTSPDSIDIAVPRFPARYSLDFNMGERTADSLYDKSYLEKRDKYSYFLSGNNAVVTIESQNKNGKTLLLIKDSFSHSMAPFLANDYQKVILLDLRYYNGSVKKLIVENEVDEVLTMFHFSTLSTDKNISKITG